MQEITSFDPNAMLFGAKLPGLCKLHCEEKLLLLLSAFIGIFSYISNVVEQLIVFIFRNVHGRCKFANKIARSCSWDVSKILHITVVFITGEAVSASTK